MFFCRKSFLRQFCLFNKVSCNPIGPIKIMYGFLLRILRKYLFQLPWFFEPSNMATGASMQAAVVALRKHKPASIVVAVPVAAPETCEEMTKIVDVIICPLRPINFYAVGLWYEYFSQVSDGDDISLLKCKLKRVTPTFHFSKRENLLNFRLIIFSMP